MVLENPYTHAYMKSALPLLADAFHDTQLSVRVAVCDLLLKVKQIKVREIKYAYAYERYLMKILNER